MSFNPIQCKSKNEFNRIYADLAQIGDKGHEVIKIEFNGKSYIPKTKSKPIWYKRVLERIYKPKNARINNVVRLLIEFLEKNQNFSASQELIYDKLRTFVIIKSRNTHLISNYDNVIKNVIQIKADAIKVIQSVVKGTIAKKALREKIAAVIKIQSVIRRNIAIEKFKEELHKKKEKEVAPISSEEFTVKLKRFDVFSKKAGLIAGELFKNIPKLLELNEVVNFIFLDCHPYKISRLLKALLIAHPSFELSDYDKIRRAIVGDRQHTLRNSDLARMFKEQQWENDDKKITGCYDLAYRMDHPYIYRVSQTSVLHSDYSLNFLWVNLNPQDRVKDLAQNIFKDGLDLIENSECIKDPKALRKLDKNPGSIEEKDLENWEKIKKSFSYRISRWTDANPGTEINLWYDSALVTQKAQQNTFEMMRAISKSRVVNLKLKDIRELPNIGGEIGNSLHPGTPVYYRVDMLKALIADHIISSPGESAKYCVVSDIDVEPMAPEQIFDQRTLDYLSNFGYVFNGVGLGNFENSFFIFNKEKKDLRKIHHKCVIQQTASKIAELRKYPIGTCFQSEYILGSQSVFNHYLYFRDKMKEPRWPIGREAPRKVVRCPSSQFNLGGHFSDSDYQQETFRFIGESNIPYTRNGRNSKYHGNEIPIEELKDWKAEQLSLVV